MNTYRKKSLDTITAIQFTGDNDAEILAFADASRYDIINLPSGPTFVLRLDTGNMQVETGWYVCKKDGGRVYSVPKEAFEEHWELI